MDKVYFTWIDRKVKKYKVQDAIEAATMVLHAKRPTIPVCLDSLGTSMRSDPITLVTLNEIQSNIVCDSIYYAGPTGHC